MIEALHFLRPLWLIALPATGLLWWVVRRKQTGDVQLGDFVAPHLRDALTINRDTDSGIRAVDGVALCMLLLTLAAAGPTWSRQVSPWFEETAPIVVAMEVTDSMRANDFMPTRLDRARFKVLDLISARTGSRTALVAYAGSAHVVVPPTTDYAVVKLFLESLDPAVMPRDGSDAATVLPVARELLGGDTIGGTLLFVNDGFGDTDPAPFADAASDTSSPSMAALVVGTVDGGVALNPDGSPVTGRGGAALDTAVDESALRRFERLAGLPVVRTTAGDSDVSELMRLIDSNLQQADDPDAEWRDQGWWLVLPALLLCVAWFRRGWTMRW